MSQSPKSLFSASRKDELASVGLDKETVKTIINQEWTSMSPFAKEKWIVLSNQVKETERPKGEERGEGESENVLNEVLKRLIALEAQNSAQAKLIKKLEAKLVDLAECMDEKPDESDLADRVELLEAKMEKARKAELFEIAHTDRATRVSNYDFINTLTQACQEHNFEQIEAWIAEGMAPNTLFQGGNGGAFTHLIAGHPEGTKVGKGFRRSDDEVCAFITKLKETHSVKLAPIQHGDPKNPGARQGLHHGYVKLALQTNHVKIAKCLYALGAEFDGSYSLHPDLTFEQFLQLTYDGNHTPQLSPAVYSFIASVSN